MTSSTGMSGLIALGVAAEGHDASRMAARSTTAGTPVKSCMSTRSGRERQLARSSPAASRGPPGSSHQAATASTWAARDLHPVLVPEQVLEQHLDGVGQPADAEPLEAGRGEREDRELLGRRCRPVARAPKVSGFEEGHAAICRRALRSRRPASVASPGGSRCRSTSSVASVATSASSSAVRCATPTRRRRADGATRTPRGCCPSSRRSAAAHRGNDGLCS